MLIVVVLMTSALVRATRAQDICSCSPLVYNWKLDFNRRCDPLNVTTGLQTGIREVFCSIEAPANATSNLIPVRVSAYQIIELDFDLAPLKSKSEEDVNLLNGDLITFASITAAEPTQYSGGIQVSLIGFNEDLDGVVLEWLVRYTNLCERSPFAPNDSIGWMIFDESTPSRPETCQLRSNFPTVYPSQSKTHLPSLNPSSLSSETPSQLPSSRPTKRFSSLPSIRVSSKPSSSFSPSDSPSNDPTSRQSIGPSMRPSSEPTKILQPSAMPSNHPSPRPSLRPVRKPNPSESPSESPIDTDSPSQFPIQFSMSFSMQLSQNDYELSRWFETSVTDFGELIDNESN